MSSRESVSRLYKEIIRQNKNKIKNYKKQKIKGYKGMLQKKGNQNYLWL